MADRRRVNGPPGGTTAPVFASSLREAEHLRAQRPVRTRQPNELRKIFLRTGITPSASGSAYLELQTPSPTATTSSDKSASQKSLIPQTSSLKLSCTVHGPRPLPRSAPFSSHLVLSTTIKYAPFATRLRRGHIRDASERDLGAHLETALRAVVIGERWPKSGVDVVVTVLEGEEDGWWGDELLGTGGDDSRGGGGGAGGGWGLMTTLAGCITVACAAMVEAGIDCVDLVSGGVAAIVCDERSGIGAGGRKSQDRQGTQLVLDPCPSEHKDIVSACVVGYLASRDEVAELWSKGDAGPEGLDLIDQAIKASVGTRTVLAATLRESAQAKMAKVAT